MRWLGLILLSGCALAPRIDECVTVIPGAEHYELNRALLSDWQLHTGELTWQSGPWVDAAGFTVGWSETPDAPVCVLDWPFTPEGR